MKKEAFAVAVLILLIASASLNTAHIEALTADVSLHLRNSQEAALSGDMDAAMDSYKTALSLWKDERNYCNVFIRHPELDSSYDTFYELEEALLSGETDSLPAAYSKLMYHLDCIAYMERLSCGSIF